MRLILFVLLGICQAAFATPKIAIIIDDVGYQYEPIKQLIDLPVPLTFAILPNTPYAKRLAEYAHKNNKEILVHLPMEGSRQEIFEPQTLTTNMKQAEFKRIASNLINAVPHAAGVNNHMGSVLTQQVTQMQWLMETINANSSNLFFVDSYTSNNSKAAIIANANDVIAIQRDVFLDNSKNVKMIEAAFNKLIKVAQRKGIAVGIAHPYPETINVLVEKISLLKNENKIQFTQLKSLYL